MKKNKVSGNVDALRSLTDEAYRRIEEMVVTLRLAPGSVVTEQELCKDLDIGRTAVREALVRLKQDGLVVVVPRRGILVRPIETTESLMTLEVRHLVETLIVERAARLSNDVDRHRFTHLADKMEQAAKDKAFVRFMRLDHSFNTLVAECAQHPVAQKVIAPLHAVSRRLGFYYAQWHAGSIEETGHAHANIMRAIAAGDEDTARQELEKLLELSRKIALSIEEELLEDASHMESTDGRKS